MSRSARQPAASMSLTVGVLLACVAIGTVVPYLFFLVATNRIDFGPDGVFVIFMVWLISIPLSFLVGVRFSRRLWRTSSEAKVDYE